MFDFDGFLNASSVTSDGLLFNVLSQLTRLRKTRESVEMFGDSHEIFCPDSEALPLGSNLFCR